MSINKSSKQSHDLATQEQVGPLMGSVSGHASDLAERVVEAVRSSSQQLHQQTSRASASTMKYIKNEPTKAVLIAAATGAALMMLVNLMFRSRHRD